MSNRFKFGFLVILSGFCLVSFYAGAAATPSVYFRTTDPSFAPGSEFVVGVFLTSDVPINAIWAEIGFSANLVEWLGSNTARSIVRVWKDSPRRSTEGTLVLEGGIPASFAGRAGELIELYFRVKEDATQPIQISLRDASVYIADGKGSEMSPARSFLAIPVSTELSQKTLPTLSDSVSPIISFFELSEEPILGRPLAVWDASDSGSGVMTEEIATRSWFMWGPWMTQKSPASIPAGVWSARIAITDRAGNRVEAILYNWGNVVIKAGISVGILLIMGLLIFFISRRYFSVS